MKIIKNSLPIALFCLASACGGGGSSSSSDSTDTTSGGNTNPGTNPPASVALAVNNDSFFVEAGGSSSLDVLGNDEGDALQLTQVSAATLGSVQIQSGFLVYTTTADATGSEAISYDVSDSSQQTASASVTVFIAPANFDASGLLALLDSDGNGLTEQELEALGVTLEAGVFASLDTNGNGVLDADELSGAGLEFLNQVLLPAFSAADLDADGELSLEEAINFVPPELAVLLQSPELQPVLAGLDGTSFSPQDLLELAVTYSEAEQEASQLSGTVMFIDNPLLGGNGDGLLSATELESGLALAGGAVSIPEGLDSTTIPLVVDALDLNNDGGLDQQEVTTMLTLLNLFSGLTGTV